MTAAERNVALYPWFRFFRELVFWQAIWFLYFQNALTPAEAILLYAVYDVSTTVLEVPSGWFSDRLGRRITLILSTIMGGAGMAILGFGDSFAAFVLGQFLLGGSAAFLSGTDTSFLYESLEEAGMTDRVEAEELRAWRFGFTGLAFSAVTGGAMALYSFTLPFELSAVAQLAALGLALRFVEPSVRQNDVGQGVEWARLASLKDAFRKPILIWLFFLTVMMYGYSHVPFVFGQPFIEQALGPLDLSAEAPLVSGAVTTAMMLISVAVSLSAEKLRARLGLAGLLLVTFAMQIGLIAVLAATDSALAIAVLLLRMVPSSLSTPFILARVQPELESPSRATFLSLKSLAGRILFAASLWLAASATGAIDTLQHNEMQPILALYSIVGAVTLVVLVIAARRVSVERPAAG